jgi:5'-nucleotidase
VKKILITNDDGYESKGLLALIEALKDIAELIIVAPSTEKSACGHSLTLRKPLRFIKLDENFYKLDDGTPADCVYLAINTLFAKNIKPDLIISGINRGANMGEDITYSGTAAAAMEGVLQNIPSIAISQVCRDKCQNIDNYGYDLAKKTIKDIVLKIFDNKFPLPKRKFLNINIPPIEMKKCKGYKITEAGYRLYGNDAHLHTNPRGDEYYWLGLHPLKWNPSKEKTCDFEGINNNYISITPVQLNMTSYEDINDLKKWIE